jgi:hypothetical protein
MPLPRGTSTTPPPPAVPVCSAVEGPVTTVTVQHVLPFCPYPSTTPWCTRPNDAASTPVNPASALMPTLQGPPPHHTDCVPCSGCACVRAATLRDMYLYLQSGLLPDSDTRVVEPCLTILLFPPSAPPQNSWCWTSAHRALLPVPPSPTMSAPHHALSGVCATAVPPRGQKWARPNFSNMWPGAAHACAAAVQAPAVPDKFCLDGRHHVTCRWT